MGRYQVNPIRKYFTFEPASNKSLCQIVGCEARIAGNHGGNLQRHIEKKHPAVYQELLGQPGLKRHSAGGGGHTALHSVVTTCLSTWWPMWSGSISLIWVLQIINKWLYVVTSRHHNRLHFGSIGAKSGPIWQHWLGCGCSWFLIVEDNESLNILYHARRGQTRFLINPGWYA